MDTHDATYLVFKTGVLMRRLLPSLLVLTVIGAVLGGCEEPSEPSILDVKYQVIDSATSFDITFRNEEGKLIETNNAYPPWDYSFQAEAGDTVYVSAQNLGQTGSVCVSIWREGEIYKSSTCTGAYCTATASSTL
jgi:hypothetical protein